MFDLVDMIYDPGSYTEYVVMLAEHGGEVPSGEAMMAEFKAGAASADEIYLPGEGQSVTGWKPDFTSNTPWAGMPSDYEGIETFVPVGDSPVPPWYVLDEKEKMGVLEPGAQPGGAVLPGYILYDTLPMVPDYKLKPAEVVGEMSDEALMQVLGARALLWILQFVIERWGAKALLAGLAGMGIAFALEQTSLFEGSDTAVYFRGRLVGYAKGSVRGRITGRRQDANNLVTWNKGWCTPGTQVNK